MNPSFLATLYSIDKELFSILLLVELIGVEPTTSALQERRSPN
jgi:hypothetical protein